MRLPHDVTGDEAVRALRRLGFVELRHERTVVVPQHRPIKPGTLRGLIEQAGLSVETFVAQL